MGGDRLSSCVPHPISAGSLRSLLNSVPAGQGKQSNPQGERPLPRTSLQLSAHPHTGPRVPTPRQLTPTQAQRVGTPPIGPWLC